jgi:methionine synthase II (cobalamin-independent)
MRTANFPSIGTLNTTLPDPGDPTYQTEALALTLHQIIKDLSDNGFEFSQVISTDLSTWTTNVQDAVDDYIEKYEDLLQTGASEVTANLPDVLSIMAAVVSGGSDAIIGVLLQGVLDVLMRHKDTRTDHYNGDTAEVDMSEVIDVLEEIRDNIAAVLTEATINVISSREDSFFQVGPPGD